MISEWVGAVLGIIGTALLSDKKASKRSYRFVGFACYLVSNFGFIIFAVLTKAWGLLLTNLVFMAFSIRGVWNNRPKEEKCR